MGNAHSLLSVPVASVCFATPSATTVSFPANAFPSALTSKVADLMVLFEEEEEEGKRGQRATTK